MPDAGRAVAEAIRAEGGRVVATLTRLLGDLEAAQDALQEAALAALERWPADGVPAQPGRLAHDRPPATRPSTGSAGRAAAATRRSAPCSMLEGADEPAENRSSATTSSA